MLKHAIREGSRMEKKWRVVDLQAMQGADPRAMTMIGSCSMTRQGSLASRLGSGPMMKRGRVAGMSWRRCLGRSQESDGVHLRGRTEHEDRAASASQRGGVLHIFVVGERI